MLIRNVQAEDAAEAAALADEADMPLEQLLAAYGYVLPASGGDGKPPGGGGGGGGCEAASNAKPADGKAAALTAEAGPAGMATAAAGSAEAKLADAGFDVMDVNGSPSPVRHSLRSLLFHCFRLHCCSRCLGAFQVALRSETVCEPLQKRASDPYPVPRHLSRQDKLP